MITLTLLALALAQSVDFTHGSPFVDDDVQLTASLDLDHDGDVDLVGWWWSPGSTDSIDVHGFALDGEGRAAPLWTLAGPSHVQTPCDLGGPVVETLVADFDDDGWDDFALGLDRTVMVFVTRAGAPPSLFTTINLTSAKASNLALADMDGDGVDELVACSATTLEVRRRTAPGAYDLFGTVGHSGGLGYLRSDIIFHDTDADGRLEVLLIRTNGPTNLLWKIGIEGGSFAGQGNLNIQVPSPSHFAAGDFDNDGDEDFILSASPCASCPATVQVLRNDGPGDLVPMPAQTLFPVDRLVDVDGDGNLDAVGATGSVTCLPANVGIGQVRVALGDGAGQFIQVHAAAVRGTARRGVAGVLDIDADGDLDLIAGSSLVLNHSIVGTTECVPGPNSTGQTAFVRLAGSSSLSRDDLLLRAVNLPPNATTIVVLGADGAQTPVGGSLLCLATPTTRLRLVAADALGRIELPLPPSTYPAVFPGAMAPGVTRRFQLWHRDVGGTFAFSTALRVVFAP
ncbi:MAG: VCBS repeat-containing protein [Planctomycetota bacterium]